MTLQNLLRIGKLRSHAPTAAEVQRLLAAIDRNLADAGVTSISDETRFDAAYKAVMQCALVAMMAAGFRPATSEPGHHLTVIQSLPLTLGVGNDVWVVLDALRKQRNANDYTGHPITPGVVSECLVQGKALRKLLRTHLAAHHADLLKTVE
ncbi:DNA-binding protein [Ideonella sp. A 288]|uniref:DNA-binding protein n=1 Tax=Ideonella sp. A 288 TaxID=1962181 RepID=UPI000B4B34BB|nr:DNA-binding protein [Ideonella sp. A 288]